MTQILEATLPAKRTSVVGTTKTLADILTERRAALEAVTPKHLTVDRLIKVAVVAVSKTPDLQKCSAVSIFQSVMAAAQLGLDCGGVLGHAYLVPFKKNTKNPDGSWDNTFECQLIIGYRGMIDLARRSGQISSIETRVVYEKDKFSLEYGFETKFTHVPFLDGDPGALRYVYAVAKLKDGGTQFEIMTKSRIDAVKSSAVAKLRDKTKGPWTDHYDEMSRKTLVRRIFKYLPVSIEIQDAAEQDDRTDGGFDLIEQGPSGAAGLNKRLQLAGAAANDLPLDNSLDELPVATEEDRQRAAEQLQKLQEFGKQQGERPGDPNAQATATTSPAINTESISASSPPAIDAIAEALNESLRDGRDGLLRLWKYLTDKRGEVIDPRLVESGVGLFALGLRKKGKEETLGKDKLLKLTRAISDGRFDFSAGTIQAE